MDATNEAVFTKDIQNKTLKVERKFNANVDRVWEAWTDATLLDQWWAPKPYKAVTKEMNFREGGHWFYAMTGPEDFIHWCKVNYLTVEDGKRFTSEDLFTDENGNFDPQFPVGKWDVSFKGDGNTTLVTTILSFTEIEDMEVLLKMGFEEGFKMGLGNLDELLKKS